MKGLNLNEDSKSIKLSGLAIINRLGRGSTSHVFKTQSIRTKELFAMKVIDKNATNYSRSALERQILIHSSLKSRNIVQFVQHIQDSENHYLLTEYCSEGEATKYLFQPLSSKHKIFNITKEICFALQYLHEESKIAHGDIKLSNILISQSEIKLCDFGFSTFLDSPANASCGTLMYTAPEILQRGKNQFPRQGDIWALGICLLILMMKNKPYSARNDHQLKQQIRKGKFIPPSKELQKQFSSEFISLVLRMLEINPKKRITVQQILDQPILSPKKMLQKIKIEDDSLEEANICNRTADTDENPSIDEQSPQNTSIFKPLYPYCLKPQIQLTKDKGYIEIKSDHSIKIKIKNSIFTINPSCTLIYLEDKNSEITAYNLQELNSSTNTKKKNKIICLYSYATEVIKLIKKKQCLFEYLQNGRYFWICAKEKGEEEESMSQKCYYNINLKQNSSQAIIKKFSQSHPYKDEKIHHLMSQKINNFFPKVI